MCVCVCVCARAHMVVRQTLFPVPLQPILPPEDREEMMEIVNSKPLLRAEYERQVVQVSRHNHALKGARLLFVFVLF